MSLVKYNEEFIFFFKQKTAYEMRISDWSSDVCSSDLIAKANGKAVSAVVQSMKSDGAKWLIDLGVTAMMVAQDLAFMRQAASAALNDFNETMKGDRQSVV